MPSFHNIAIIIDTDLPSTFYFYPIDLLTIVVVVVVGFSLKIACNCLLMFPVSLRFFVRYTMIFINF